MPWAITRSTLAVPDRESVHGRESQVKAAADRILPGALGSGVEHRPARGRSPTTFQPRRASGIALRPAPQPRSSARARSPCRHSVSANRIRTAFGRDCANPATVPGAFHDEPASGSMLGPYHAVAGVSDG